MSSVVRDDAPGGGGQAAVPLPAAQPSTSAEPVPAGAATPDAANSAKRPRKRLHVLDGLRLIAALMVVAFHYMGYDHWYRSPWGASTSKVFPTAHSVAAYGWLGVELFFLISGFVICLSTWDRTPRQFAVSRFMRLYPAYWFAVALTSAVLVLRPGGWDGKPSEILANFTMFQEPMGMGDVDGVYWSLWAELRFYLLFAIVAALGLTFRRVVGFCVTWLAVAALAPILNVGFITLMAVPQYTPFFVGGLTIYLMQRFGLRRPVLWLLLGASWFMAQDALHSLVHDADRSVGGGLSWRVAVTVVTVFYALVLAAALGKLDVFNWKVLGVAGGLTYPLYLLHEDLGWEVIKHTHGKANAGVLVCALVAAMLAASWMVQRYVERPAALRIKAWLL
jgi:peptidoglycan/LPS O-acetylase OafA/YrhL